MIIWTKSIPVYLDGKINRWFLIKTITKFKICKITAADSFSVFQSLIQYVCILSFELIKHRKFFPSHKENQYTLFELINTVNKS